MRAFGGGILAGVGVNAEDMTARIQWMSISGLGPHLRLLKYSMRAGSLPEPTLKCGQTYECSQNQINSHWDLLWELRLRRAYIEG